MPENKKQHYVPRFYLKEFSSNGKSINIWLPERKQAILRANLRNQCYKNYFYGSDPTFETALSYIEAQTSEVFRIADSYLELPPPGSLFHHVLVLYVLLQHSRTVYSAESINEAMDKMAKHAFRNKAASMGINIDDFFIGVENPSLYAMGIAIPCYPILLDLEYKLLVNLTDTEFITSDNPAVLYNKLLPYDGTTSQIGLSSRGLQLFLPINPRITLILFDREVYRVGANNNPVVCLDRDSDVHDINSLQMCSSLSCLYFRDERFNVESLHRKASRFRFGEKVKVDVFEQSTTNNRVAEVLALSRQEIRMSLNVSCIKISRAAKTWRREFRQMNPRPVAVPRNEHLLQIVEQVRTKMKDESFDFVEHINFVEERCGQYWRDV